VSIVGRVAHSHLFRGAEVDIPGMDDPVGPFTIAFTDGSATTAEILDGILTTGAYRTTAGTRIPDRAWPIRERSWTAGLLHLRLGPRLP
jgi:hypothetical protein